MFQGKVKKCLIYKDRDFHGTCQFQYGVHNSLRLFGEIPAKERWAQGHWKVLQRCYFAIVEDLKLREQAALKSDCQGNKGSTRIFNVRL